MVASVYEVPPCFTCPIAAAGGSRLMPLIVELSDRVVSPLCGGPTRLTAMGESGPRGLVIDRILCPALARLPMSPVHTSPLPD